MSSWTATSFPYNFPVLCKIQFFGATATKIVKATKYKQKRLISTVGV